MPEKAIPAVTEPPKVEGLPILGNVLDMIRSPLPFLRQAHQTYGDIFRVNVATRDYIVMAGIEANRFMAGEGRELIGSTGTWGEFMKKTNSPHLLIGSDGESHAYQRKLLKPFFAKVSFRDRMHFLVDTAREALADIEHEKVQVAPFLRSLFALQIGLILQNTRLSSREIEEFMYAQNVVMSVYMLGKWPRLALLNPKYLYCQYQANRFSRRLVEDNRKAGDHPFETYMDKIEQGRAEHPEWFTEGDVHAHTMLPFVGGIDPVTGTMQFVLYELFRQPALRERVQREVDEACKDGFPDFEQLMRMQDTFGFILETMRLHPVGFVLPRSATDDFEFAGYRVPRGSDLLMFTAANHFKEEFFPNPETFDIERYREPRNEHRERGAFAPFGRGPHTCVANGLAELQLLVNTVAILHYFDMELLTPLEKLKTVYNPIPAVSTNFRIAFTRKSSVR